MRSLTHPSDPLAVNTYIHEQILGALTYLATGISFVPSHALFR